MKNIENINYYEPFWRCLYLDRLDIFNRRDSNSTHWIRLYSLKVKCYHNQYPTLWLTEAMLTRHCSQFLVTFSLASPMSDRKIHTNLIWPRIKICRGSTAFKSYQRFWNRLYKFPPNDMRTERFKSKFAR